MTFPIDYTRRDPHTLTGMDAPAGRIEAATAVFSSTITTGAASYLSRKLGQFMFAPEDDVFFEPAEVAPFFLGATGIRGLTEDRVRALGMEIPKYDRPIGAYEFFHRSEEWAREYHRQRRIARGPRDRTQSLLNFGAGMLGAFGDPIELGIGFLLPHAAVSSKLIKAAKTARARQYASVLHKGAGRARLRRGALEGGFGNAVTEPFWAMQQDYKGVHPWSIGDSVINILAGAALGAGFRYAGGSIRDFAGRRGVGTTLDAEAKAFFAGQTGVVGRTIDRSVLDGASGDVEAYIAKHWDPEFVSSDMDTGGNLLSALLMDFEYGVVGKSELYNALTALDIGVARGDITAEAASKAANKLVREADEYRVLPENSFEFAGVKLDEVLPDSVEAPDTTKLRHHSDDPEVQQLELELDNVSQAEAKIKEHIRASILCEEPQVTDDPNQTQLDYGQAEFAFVPDEGERIRKLRQQGHLRTLSDNVDNTPDGPEQMEFGNLYPAYEQTALDFAANINQAYFNFYGEFPPTREPEVTGFSGEQLYLLEGTPESIAAPEQGQLDLSNTVDTQPNVRRTEDDGQTTFGFPGFPKGKVKYVRTLGKSHDGTPRVGTRNRKTGDIQVVRFQITQKYKKKAWTKPKELADGTRATPLAEDAFVSKDHFLAFILEHEDEHGRQAQREGEALGAYEDRINQAAYDKVDFERKPESAEGSPVDIEDFANRLEAMQKAAPPASRDTPDVIGDEHDAFGQGMVDDSTPFRAFRDDVEDLKELTEKYEDSDYSGFSEMLARSKVSGVSGGGEAEAMAFLKGFKEIYPELKALQADLDVTEANINIEVLTGLYSLEGLYHDVRESMGATPEQGNIVDFSDSPEDLTFSELMRKGRKILDDYDTRRRFKERSVDVDDRGLMDDSEFQGTVDSIQDESGVASKSFFDWMEAKDGAAKFDQESDLTDHLLGGKEEKAVNDVADFMADPDNNDNAKMFFAEFIDEVDPEGGFMDKVVAEVGLRRRKQDFVDESFGDFVEDEFPVVHNAPLEQAVELSKADPELHELVVKLEKDSLRYKGNLDELSQHIIGKDSIAIKDYINEQIDRYDEEIPSELQAVIDALERSSSGWGFGE